MALEFKKKRTVGSESAYNLSEHLLRDDPHPQYFKRASLNDDGINLQLALHVNAELGDALNHTQFLRGVNDTSTLQAKIVAGQGLFYTLNATGMATVLAQLAQHTHASLYAALAHTHPVYADITHSHSEYVLTGALQEYGLVDDITGVLPQQMAKHIETTFTDFAAEIGASAYNELSHYPAGTRCTNTYVEVITYWERTNSGWVSLTGLADPITYNLDDVVALSRYRVEDPTDYYNAPATTRGGILQTFYTTVGGAILTSQQNAISATAYLGDTELLAGLESFYQATGVDEIYVYGTKGNTVAENRWWSRTGENTWVEVGQTPVTTKVYASLTTSQGGTVVQLYIADNGDIYTRTGVYEPEFTHNNSAHTTVDSSYRNYGSWKSMTSRSLAVGQAGSVGGTTAITATTNRWVTVSTTESTAITITGLAIGEELMVRINNTDNHTVTFNGISLSTGTGVELARFVNITGTVECIGCEPILA